MTEQVKSHTVSNPVEVVVSVPVAVWNLELNCRCPKCDEYIDLLEGGDFWENNRVEVCEHSTDKSKNIDAHCEGCEHEFKVNLAY